MITIQKIWKDVTFVALGSFLMINATAQDCSDLFFSEYVEGWSNNKAVEIYNPTENAIDLAEYRIDRHSNGAVTAGDNQILELSGVLQPYDVKVYVLDKLDPDGQGQDAPVWDELQAVADEFVCPDFDQNNTMYFNGNDFLLLVKIEGENVVDSFGRIGEDPGNPSDGGGWNNVGPDYNSSINGEVPWTTNHTLVRKSNVLIGDIQVFDVFNVGLEYDSLPANTFSSLGYHECDCDNQIQPILGCMSSTACNFNPLANEDDFSCIEVGDDCDDGDQTTTNDQIDENCDCTGTQEQVNGCTDSSACNYNELAELDDGSCQYVPLFDIIGNTGVNPQEQVTYFYNQTVGSTYSWIATNGAVLSGQGTNSVDVVWGDAGSASLSVTETTQDGCVGESVSVDIGILTSVFEADQQQIQVYPNPATDRIHVKGAEHGSSFSIIDPRGRIIISDVLGDSGVVDIRSVEKGTYFIMLQESNSSTLVKTLYIH